MRNNFSKLVLAATFGLALALTISCSSKDDDDSDYQMLNGVWDRGDIVVTFNGSNAVFTEIKPNSGWQNVSSIRIGDKKFKDITGSNLKWTCKELTYNSNTYAVSGWENCTITMSANSQTITVVTPETGNPTTTYTKVE